MIPKRIHLIWFGDDLTGLAARAVEHWRQMGGAREIILHRDDASLLPQWREAWKLATNPSMQSDLLRWSLLLTLGGWYFDCDVRTRLTLDEIEADCQLDGTKCFITLFGSAFSPPASDILACDPNWPGRAAVIDYVRSQREPNRIHHWTFAGEMIGTLLREHSEWFIAAPPERYSMITASREQLVFLRGGQNGEWLKRQSRWTRPTKKLKSHTPLDADHGPGDYLHDAILRWVGESPTEDCQCRSRIAQMNAWGPAGCREHLEEIVDWLLAEATKRGWWKCAVVVPGSRLFLRRMVLGAIKKVECVDCGLQGASIDDVQ